MIIYIHDRVSDLRSYYKDFIDYYPSGQKILSRLEDHARLLWKAYNENNPVILNEINNYHPDFISNSWEEIRKKGFSNSHANETCASQYGYDDFSEIPDELVDVQFEKAVDLLLSGSYSKLEILLASNHNLVRRKSQYGHSATLLHYIGSNGVELYRQIVPLNLPKMMKLLINYSADINATMKVYGGHYKMIDLLNTSAHPKGAGVLDEVNKLYNQLTQ